MSLSRVSKIPRWALLKWHNRSIIWVVGGGKLIYICMSKKHQLQLLRKQTCKINVVSSANVLHTIFHWEHAHLEILNFFSHVIGTGFTRQESNLQQSIAIHRKVAVGSKGGKQDIARNTLTHKRVEHTGELKFWFRDLWGAVKVLQVFFFLSRDFNVCIKLSGNVYGLEIRHGICLRLNFGPGTFWDFDFCPIQSSLLLEIWSTNTNNYSHKQTSFLVTVFDWFLYGFVIQANKLFM